MDRPITDREHAVLDTLLAVDFGGVETYRSRAPEVRVIGMCRCGCPSVDFHNEPASGCRSSCAGVRQSFDGLVMYAIAGRLGGIEHLSKSDEMAAELPSMLQIQE